MQALMDEVSKNLPGLGGFMEHVEAGAYTRPLLTSTSAILISEPVCVPFVTSYDPSIY